MAGCGDLFKGKKICGDYYCGRIGFTTGTGDALTVLQQYEKIAPRSALSKYIPTLRKIDTLAQCDSGRDNTSELVNFDKAWTRTSCRDARFNTIQDQINDDMYFTPALKFAKKMGIESNLGKSIFYDTIVQHGWQMNEADINLVKILICCYPDDTWPSSADRVADLQDVVAKGDLNLSRPIFLQNYGIRITGNETTNTPGPQCK